LAELPQSYELELIYAHLHSLRNVTAMAERLSGTSSAAGASAEGSQSSAESASAGTEERASEKGKKKSLASTNR